MMRVAAVQFCPDRDPTHPEAALDRSRGRLLALVEQVAGGSDLVVLPEMAATGYLFPSVEAVLRVAEGLDGPTIAAFAEAARRHGTWIVGGFPERDGDTLYNSAFVLDRAGVLQQIYRKRLLFQADEHWATPGDRPYGMHDTGNGRFGVGICMDLNDDAMVDWLLAEQPDALAFPTNWVQEGEDTWDYWGWRTEGFAGALVAANRWGAEHASGRAARVGEPDTVSFSGASAVMRRRLILAHTPRDGDSVVRAILSRAARGAPRGR